jgi:hypothetical protein
MPGAKIPVLEIERLGLTEDGRGIVLYNDGINFVVQSASPWTGISSNGTASSKKFFPSVSSMGWLKVHYVSSSTYGPTGATAYIPIYRNLDTNIP